MFVSFLSLLGLILLLAAAPFAALLAGGIIVLSLWRSPRPEQRWMAEERQIMEKRLAETKAAWVSLGSNQSRANTALGAFRQYLGTSKEITFRFNHDVAARR